MEDLVIAKRFVYLSNRAGSKKIAFNLTIASMRNLLAAKKCYYTGIPLQTEDNTRPDYLTIDRKDYREGYVKGNVVACSHAANQLKSVIENNSHFLDHKQRVKLFRKTIKEIG